MRIPKILLGKVSCRKKINKNINCAVRSFSVAKVGLFCLIFADFHAKTRKFAYRWPTLNLNCAKTVTDRKMRFSPLVQKCLWDVPIGSTSFSNKNSPCMRRFRYIFYPDFCDMSEMVMFTDPPRTAYVQ